MDDTKCPVCGKELNECTCPKPETATPETPAQ